MEKATSFGLHTISAPAGSRTRKKQLGRGPGSGHGKTSCRGSKGQTSRTGPDFYPGFEGGQSPFIRRIPKRGFTSKFQTVYQIVNLTQLSKIDTAETITPEVMWKKGLVASRNQMIKVLGNGDVNGAVTVQAHSFSKSAEDKIKKAGGKTEVINV
jgi:large subunit ribosomal protein L15